MLITPRCIEVVQILSDVECRGVEQWHGERDNYKPRHASGTVNHVNGNMPRCKPGVPSTQTLGTESATGK
jgi:hypothetical protein